MLSTGLRNVGGRGGMAGEVPGVHKKGRRPEARLLTREEEPKSNTPVLNCLESRKREQAQNPELTVAPKKAHAQS